MERRGINPVFMRRKKRAIYDRIQDTLIVDSKISKEKRQAQISDIVAELGELGIYIPIVGKNGKRLSSNEIASHIQEVVFPDPVSIGLITDKTNRTDRERQIVNLARFYNRIYGANIRIKQNYLDPNDNRIRSTESILGDLLLVSENVTRQLLRESENLEGNLGDAIDSLINSKKQINMRQQNSLEGLDQLSEKFNPTSNTRPRDNVFIGISAKLNELIEKESSEIIKIRAQTADSSDALRILQRLYKQYKDGDVEGDDRNNINVYLAALSLTIACNINESLQVLLSKFSTRDTESNKDIVNRLKVILDGMKKELSDGIVEVDTDTREAFNALNFIVNSFSSIKDTFKDAANGFKYIFQAGDNPLVNIHDVNGITSEDIAILKKVLEKENLDKKFFNFNEIPPPGLEIN